MKRIASMGWLSLAGVLAIACGTEPGDEGFEQVDGVSEDVSAQDVLGGGSHGAGWETMAGLMNGAPALAAASDGRLDLLFRSRTNDHLLWYRKASLYGDWPKTPVDLGQSLASSPAAISFDDGRTDVVYRAQDGRLKHKRYTPAGGWASESDIGAATLDPSLVSRGNGRLDLFYRGADNRLKHRYYPYYLISWSPEQDLGGKLDSSPAASAATDESIDVFWFASNRLMQKSYRQDTGWQNEKDLGTVSRTFVASPRIDPRSRAAGVSWLSSTGELLRKPKTWVGYGATESMGITLKSDPALASSQPGRLDIVASVDTVGSVRYSLWTERVFMPLRGQEQSQWCWAASTQMVVCELGDCRSQCDIVQDYMEDYGLTPQGGCCGFPAFCNMPASPIFALQAIGRNALMTPKGQALSLSAIRTEIDAGRPFIGSWRWTGGGGHAIVVSDTFRYRSNDWVAIKDPGPVGVGSEYVMPYTDFVGNTRNDRSHGHDYYHIY